MKDKKTKDGEGVIKFDGFFKRFTTKGNDKPKTKNDDTGKVDNKG